MQQLFIFALLTWNHKLFATAKIRRGSNLQTLAIHASVMTTSPRKHKSKRLPKTPYSNMYEVHNYLY